MVYSSTDPARQSYRLWHRFSMPTTPTTYGTSDAVAVEAYVAHELTSAYTFLLEHIVLVVWALIVLFGVLVSIRKYEKNHDDESITRELWAKRSSPFEILKLAIVHFLQNKNRNWMTLVWVVPALGFLVMKYAIPIVFAHYIIIDTAAPVDPQTIYVPSYRDVVVVDGDPTTLLKVIALEVPSALRAMGSVDSVNGTGLASSSIFIDQPEILAPDSATGDPNQRINYRYTVTGRDFGLQNYPDLILSVEGSCYTEYSWYAGTYLPNGTTVTQDVYNLYNDASSSSLKTVSLDDGPSPAAQFFEGYSPGTGPASNLTWVALVSSVDRKSYYESNDPWYMTVPSNNTGPPFQIKPGRPALSCWQNDVWSYRGSNSSIIGLNSTALPGLDLPLPLQNIFAHFLGTPKIPILGSRLGASALKSASTSVSSVFNASSSSMYDDLQRLAFASYIATVNTLTETTLFAPDGGVRNDILVNGQIPDGIEEFVIWSNNVITLSVKALIVIPVLTVVLWIILIAVLVFPIPGMVALSKKPPGKDEEANGKPEELPQEESRTEKLLADIITQVSPSD